MGPYSNPNSVGVEIQTEPDAPTYSPTLIDSSETYSVISMDPSTRTLTASLPILYYEL